MNTLKSNLDMMKKNKRMTGLFALLLAALLLTPAAKAQTVNPKPFTVPEITEWQGAEGTLELSGRVIVNGKSAALNSLAELFAQQFRQVTGKPMAVAKGRPKAGDITLTLKPIDNLGKEGYRMTVGQGVSLHAQTIQGLQWATRTVLQICDKNGAATLPKGVAIDVPQYPLRGFMIDCGRKYIPIAYLRNLVSIMAYYKMNTLQIHLNDNGFKQFFGDDWSKTQAAFRLQCDTYPGLTAKDGSYTKQEFIDLQKWAEQQGVEIIPEIDSPAHSLAFTHYKPELASKDYGADHLDLFNPETYKFMDALFDEYLGGKEPVFRGKRVHIGTDEYSNAKKEVVEKFREYTDHYIKYVEKYGKQAVLWGALTHANGDTPVKSENVIMDCWYNGFAQPRDMKEQGYKLVSISDGFSYIVPAAGYYYDYLNCQWLYDAWTPATIGGEKFEENDPAILGGMFAVWNDHAGNGISVKDIHHRVYPALQTIAAKTWTGKLTTLPYADFDQNRWLLHEAPGVNELARYGTQPATVLEQAEVLPGSETGFEEIGYDYSVTFTVEGQKEEKGTVLFSSDNATFYLADPEQGKLGFMRDGYLNTFNYRIPEGRTVTLTIQGNNRMTRLLENGQQKEELGPKTLYVVRESNRAHYQRGEAALFEPKVYDPADKIYYQRTLVFPLRRAGNFKSKVTNLKVENHL